MSYRVYIKNDYKPVVRWVPEQPWYRRRGVRLVLAIAVGLVSLWSVRVYTSITVSPPDSIAHTASIPEPVMRAEVAKPAHGDPARVSVPVSADIESVLPVAEPEWQTVTVQAGENLSLIFDRLRLSPATLFQVISLGNETASLKKLIPGQKLHFHIEDGVLQSLKYEPSMTMTLLVRKDGDGYHSKSVISELENRVRETSGVINDSLYLAAIKAGLTDNLSMRLINIYGWDIDFVLDIRSGDSFKVIYEERYKEGIKVEDGPILAAEFTNRGNTYSAVRYTSPDGETGYYNEEGFSMRKAFLRTPLNFSYISSRFDLNRKHPILNRIRAHMGVDYAAPSGTPVKAAGDGTVVSIGRNGGYGNVVVLRHGGIYNTAYAHLRSFARGLKRGSHVKQGDIIGYVGMTGLATGPHLHYEFRVNGVHRNPLTVKLPKALRVPDEQMAYFREQTGTLLAQLQTYDTRNYAGQSSPDELIIALDDTNNSLPAR